MNTDSVKDVTTFALEGLALRTGDLICTTDGEGPGEKGQFWWLLGRLIPGDVDHIVIYVGPGGRCVEAAAKGSVVAFELSGPTWDAPAMFDQRGVRDLLYGIGDPVAGRGLDSEDPIRLAAANYCLDQARQAKPYNLNFLDSGTDKAFYCSQLAYKAYLPLGIDLNSGVGVPSIPGTGSIIFPQEVWNACRVKRRAKP
ncbi:hypothetical protein [Mesoterricola silvestris]|uniref:Permuted papain-like amidase YaeF/Yiix C92 family enzyme n=1 Tax=Mesoterricola silvestris TaxID=2927979 RepID=A0AA48K9H8_9BACT|nr:hypothetical protein [Mesoterricola silvestris]BDU74014.1 hypothetical protein METEAL_31880 [Mesoterricola silvestris]